MHRVSLAHISAAVLALALYAGAEGEAAPSPDVPVVFSGRMLIAVKPAQARQVERSAPSRAGGDQWRFDRVAARPSTRGGAPPAREWLVATPPATHRASKPKGSPWDMAHRMVDGEGAYRGMIGALSRAAGTSAKPQAVEPDMFYAQDRWPRKLIKRFNRKRYRSKTQGRELTVADKNSVHWPEGGEFAWHLADQYSQLGSAREYVRQHATPGDPGRRVKIGMIDTGYSENHVLNPDRLDKEASRDFSDDPLNPTVGAVDPFNKGKLNMPGHGCGVMSIVAGSHGKLRDAEFEDYIGGAPAADVVFCRVADSVIHFFPSRMALAIKYATSIECDVLNISHGGMPSGLLVDAVNEAYENGTAIIAAAGDFFETPLFGLSSPQQVVYPAAFSRVIAVTGATARGTSYGRAPSKFSLLTFRDWKEWMLRGSFGPLELMHEAIGGYAPNIPWARYTAKGEPNLLDLNGMGTSAATPQVTAAAALWLQLNRDDPYLSAHWRSWEKVEAVYWALFDSAQKHTPEGSSTYLYYGNGLLKARDALDIPVLHDPVKRPPAKCGLHWVRLLAGFLPGIRAAPGEETDSHNTMVRTEIAQLVHGSIPAQELVARAGLSGRTKDVPPWASSRRGHHEDL